MATRHRDEMIRSSAQSADTTSHNRRADTWFGARQRRWPARAALALLVAVLTPLTARAQEPPRPGSPTASFFQLFGQGDLVGTVIVILLLLLSVTLVALVIEHLLTIRRSALIPPGLAEEMHRLLNQGHFAQAEQQCKLRPSFLAHVLQAGLAEIRMGYSAVEKAMEDASQEQAARLLRKIEYLAVIGNIAPMLGLLGTVWGMLMAFADLPQQVTNRTEALAYDINVALWTTVLGLMLAIPALTAFAIFRNRVDHLAAECTLLAEHIFAGFKRLRSAARKAVPAGTGPTTEAGS